MPVAFQTVVAEVLSLPPDDQRRLRELLSERLAEVPPSALSAEEDALEQDLLAEGLLDQVPAAINDFAPYRNRKLIPVQGNAASERLIAERR
jgi:hypothetical protein